MEVPTYDTIFQQILDQVPDFAQVYQDHVDLNDKVLPHVLMGDLTRFVVEQADQAAARGTSATQTERNLDTILRILELGMGSQDPRLQELISVSFLENLPPNNALPNNLKRLLGPALRRELNSIQGDT